MPHDEGGPLDVMVMRTFQRVQTMVPESVQDAIGTLFFWVAVVVVTALAVRWIVSVGDKHVIISMASDRSMVD